MVVHPSVPAKTVTELVALCKSKPRSISYASSGTGGITHLAAELFSVMTGAEMSNKELGAYIKSKIVKWSSRLKHVGILLE